jgi:methyltransferase (TIGR00027 family)
VPALISNVSDTARWVAFYRAMETERPDAVFRDPFARRLAGAKGEAIVQAMPEGRSMAWPLIVRTAVMDEIILREVRAGVDQVVNLAAGLDTRPWRLPLPPDMRWVDVDLPGILDEKLEAMSEERPVCRYEPVRMDLADEALRRDLFARLGNSGSRTLVVTEGLLIYLPPDAVAGLARDLHAQPAFALWLLDLASPQLLQMMEKNWAPVVRAGGAPFRFGPAENTRFFEPTGWRELEYRGTFDEGTRLKRTMKYAWFWRLLGRFMPKERQEAMKRFSGIVLLGSDRTLTQGSRI